MLRIVLALVSLVVLSAPLAAQEEQSTFSTAIVPVVGAVTGLGGVRWATDVELRNPFGSAVTVALLLAAAPDGQFQIVTLESGQTVALPDIVRETFGIEGLLSPLIVRSEGTRSVTVTATIRGRGPDGAVRPQSQRVLYNELLPMRTVLNSLDMTKERRTNIGFGNIGDTPMRVTLALRRLAGRDVATRSLVLPPQSVGQVSLATLFPEVSSGENLSLICEYYGTTAYAYASVLRNDTHDGTFYSP